MLNIVSVIIVLGVLIFVHEAGHFLAAKAVGVQVLRFPLGFGRPLLAWRRGETEYWVSWLPIGGDGKKGGVGDGGEGGGRGRGGAGGPSVPAPARDRRP